MRETIRYWDKVIRKMGDAHSPAMWRVHSDTINGELVSRWQGRRRVKSSLKTDLFDEAFGDGVYPFLDVLSQDVVGIDLSVSSVKNALERHKRIKGIAADVRSLPFPDCSFDLVVSNSTLDHFNVSDQIIVGLQELHRVLKKDGHLIVTLDNPANPLIVIRNSLPFRLLQSIGLVPYYVGETFSIHHLVSHLKQSGFEIIKTGSVLHCPRVFAIVLARIIDRMAITSIRRRFLRFLMAFEHLEKWPTRYLTGHFIAVLAEKR